MAWAVSAESAVSFFGLTGDYPSWGRLVASGKADLHAWWLIATPSLLIVGTVLSCAALAGRLGTARGEGEPYRAA